jgi:hypothetical protein
LGRGRIVVRASTNRDVRADGVADFHTSLSPRERAGVRGKEAFDG